MSVPPPLPVPDPGLLLDRHAGRRAGGITTVSVLVGSIGPGIAVFRAWANGHGHPIRFGPVSDATEVTDLLIETAAGNRDLLADAYAYLAAHIGRPVAELRAALATRHDLDLFFTANDALLPSGDGTRLARRLCESAFAGAGPTGGRSGHSGADRFAELAGLAALIPLDGAPAVLLTPPAVCDVREWFRTAGAAAVAVTTQAPRFPIAVAVPVGVWSRYRTEEADGRVKAILAEGAVELPVLSREEVERRLARDVAPRQVPPAIAPAISEGAPGSFAVALVAAAAAPTRAATADEDDVARSAAERFLYEFLELLPATAGRFELNADAGFRFGPRAAEVDLLARDLRIAIEIDGYYHFRDDDGYRRDRSKDWELQRRGFLVLRFLADDIIPRLEEVRDRILAAVDLRTAGNTA